MLCQTVVPLHRLSSRLWFNTVEHVGMAPQRGLYFHVCQSSSIPAQGGHKYTFMPPREILKGAVCPSPVWTHMAIVLIDDGSKVWRMPLRVPQSHLFGSFTFEHNSCSAVFMWALHSSALHLSFWAVQRKSYFAGLTSPKSHIFCFHSFKHAGSLFWQTLSSQFAIIRSLCGSTAAVWFGLADFSLCFTHRHICVFVNEQVWHFFSACPGPKCSYIVYIKVYMLPYLHTDRKQVCDVEGKHFICVLPQSDLTWLPRYIHFNAAFKVALRCLMPSQSITRWLVGSAVSC